MNFKQIHFFTLCFLVTGIFLIGVGCEPKPPKDPLITNPPVEVGPGKKHAIQRETARLMAAKSFALYAKTGEFKRFDMSTTKLIDSNNNERSFRNSEIQYTIISPNTAIIAGNQGTAEVEMIRDDKSITFIETTPFGNKMVAIIYDEWNPKENGFQFTYTRHIESPLSNSIMRSTYTGIAKIK